MYKRKVRKSEKPSDKWFDVINPHHVETSLPLGEIRVISIDPAWKNLAIRGSKRYTHGPTTITMELFEKLCFHPDLPSTFRQIYDFLDSQKEYFRSANLLIIERQMLENYRMIRISQHIISYFYKLWEDQPHHPLIVEVDSKLKGWMLGFDRRRDFDLKEWSPIKAKEILAFHCDLKSIEIMNSLTTKEDDLGDTVCQEEALFMLIYP